MTTTTDQGLDWYADKARGVVTDDLDTIALGTGTGNESTTATSLANQVHQQDDSGSDVTFPDGDAAGEFEAVINITGGAEVPDGTEITEIAVFSNSGVLVHIDEFSKVTVDQGHTEEFTVPIGLTR